MADTESTSTTVTMDANKTVTANFETFTIQPGDANGDGELNALDVIKIERIIAGLDLATPGADANEDGNYNALDITKTERLIVGLDTTLSLSSTAFQDGETIPTQYTCDGQDLSTPLSWTGPPGGTQSFALIVDDPDHREGHSLTGLYLIFRMAAASFRKVFRHRVLWRMGLYRGLTVLQKSAMEAHAHHPGLRTTIISNFMLSIPL